MRLTLPEIPANSNKYSRGSLLIAAGSARFPGAAVLAAKAAERAGAGYVSLAIPDVAVAVAQSHLLTVPVVAAPSANGAFAANAWAGIREQVRRIDATVVGPGITNTTSTVAFVEQLINDTDCPMVIDADALNALAEINLIDLQLDERHILTPHAGEIARLCVASNTGSAKELAIKTGATVVEKGPTTYIFSPSKQSSSNKGTAALAKAGTGDVLAGIVGALLAQGMEPFEAACAGVEIHSGAGCLAEQKYGMRSVIAQDVIDFIPDVLQAL